MCNRIHWTWKRRVYLADFLSFKIWWNQQTNSVLEKMFWRRLSSSSSEDVLRRLQDGFIKTNIFTLLIRFQKMTSRRLEDVLIKTSILVLVIHFEDLFKTFSRRLQDVYKTFCKNVFKTSSRRPQDVFKTSSRPLQDVFKTSSGDL